MIPLGVLPAVNAGLNAASAALLGAGYFAIRRRRVRVHRACMLGALGTSTLFLASYVTYHLYAGTTRFPGQGWTRPVYFALLGTHTLCAAAVPPLALTTLAFALRGRFVRHVRLARWTLPIWLYVSVTGVVIYVLLYRVYAPSPGLARRAAATAPPSARAAKLTVTTSERESAGNGPAGGAVPR